MDPEAAGESFSHIVLAPDSDTDFGGITADAHA
jgi:hypothetical protein